MGKSGRQKALRGGRGGGRRFTPRPQQEAKNSGDESDSNRSGESDGGEEERPEEESTPGQSKLPSEIIQNDNSEDEVEVRFNRTLDLSCLEYRTA